MRIQTLTLRGNHYQLLLIVSLLIIIALTHTPAVNAEKITRPVVVYKSPSCGCCGAWVDHIEQAGYSTNIQHPKDLNTIKDQLGVSPVYQACHTAVHKGYVFEGHIPASVIQHFLASMPDALGLAVPGMPLGSPGMDTNSDFRAYEVLVLHKDGSSTPYARISSNDIIYLEKRS